MARIRLTRRISPFTIMSSVKVTRRGKGTGREVLWAGRIWIGRGRIGRTRQWGSWDAWGLWRGSLRRVRLYLHTSPSSPTSLQLLTHNSRRRFLPPNLAPTPPHHRTPRLPARPRLHNLPHRIPAPRLPNTTRNSKSRMGLLPH